MFKIRNNEFKKNIFINTLGHSLAQLLLVFAMPILTRIYSPQQFAGLAIFIAILSLVAGMANGKFEMAIVLPKQDSVAISLLKLCFLFAFAVSGFCSLVVIFGHSLIIKIFNNQYFSLHLIFLPFAVLLTAITQPLMWWSIRKKQFSIIAISRLCQSVYQTIGQIIFSLITGNILATLIVNYYFLKKNKNIIKKIFHVSNRKLIFAYIKYKSFLKFVSCGAVLETLSMQLPVLLVSMYYTEEITGQISLAVRLLHIPSVLITSAFTQVLFQKISINYNQNQENLLRLVLVILFSLITIFIPFLLFLYFYGQESFIVFFGKEWGVSGKYAAIMAISFMIKFAINPLNSFMSLPENNKKFALWYMNYVATLILTLLYAKKFDILIFIKIYVLHDVFQYLCYLLIILKQIKNSNDQNYREQLCVVS